MHLLITRNNARLMVQSIPLRNIVTVDSQELLKDGVLFEEKIFGEDDVAEKCRCY